MAYRVEITGTAEKDLDALYRWVIERAPHRGPSWFNGMEVAILSLDRRPTRCPLAPESLNPNQPIRVLHCGRGRHVYKIFFTVDEGARTVRILHVRHGARRPTGFALEAEKDE